MDGVKLNAQRSEDSFIQRCLNAVAEERVNTSPPENLTQLFVDLKKDLGSLQQQVARVCLNLSSTEEMYQALATNAELNKLEDKLQDQISSKEVEIKDIKEMLFNDWYRYICKSAKEFLSGNQIAPVIIKFSKLWDYTYPYKYNSWSSAPFYTHKNGYRVTLMLIEEDIGSAERYDFQTAYLQCVEGRNDAQLNCTFSEELEMNLLDEFRNNSKNVFATNFTYDCSDKHELLYSNDYFTY